MPNRKPTAEPTADETRIYLRVSSKTQDVKSQEPDAKRWADAHGVAWCAANVYRDKFTGKSLDRPAFNRLLADVEAGRVKRIVVWRLDRLGRTAKGLTALFEDLLARGVTLVSLREGFDLSTPAGRLMANVLASVAAYETEVRAERVLAGQAKARSEGKTWGGGVKGKRIKVTAEARESVRRMKLENRPVAAMARATGLSRPTVYSILADLAELEDRGVSPGG